MDSEVLLARSKKQDLSSTKYHVVRDGNTLKIPLGDPLRDNIVDIEIVLTVQLSLSKEQNKRIGG